MPAITNVGGSVTSALVLTAFAWAVRLLRAAATRSATERRAKARRDNSRMGRFASALSPAALKLLLETDPFPHVLLDVRTGDPPAPLPEELSGALRIPLLELQDTLKPKSGSWERRFSSPPPLQDTVLVFITESEEASEETASIASACGYQKSMVIAGGLACYLAQSNEKAQQQFINRDAVASILGAPGAPGVRVNGIVLDLRRHDERSLYGFIPGTKHLPVEQLPSALDMPADTFQSTYHFDKPLPSDVLVMQCRTSRRAAWAGQVFADRGFGNCLIYRQGVYGWQLDQNVKKYASYDPGQIPPEPEDFTPDTVDHTAAHKELQSLGLL